LGSSFPFYSSLPPLSEVIEEKSAKEGGGMRASTGIHRRFAATALAIAVLAAPAGAAEAPHGSAQSERRDVELRKCRGGRARCGHIKVLLDRADPSLGKIKIGFELYRRKDRSRPKLGTIVASEGGPGYSTTGSRSSYLDLFKPLRKRRNLLLVDNRGTGKSEPILCQPLQSYEGDYVDAVGKCGRQLGPASDLYGTGNAADDLAEVLDALGIEKVDLYGDSYGTFFGQTFAVRHPERLRSLVLDSAYFVGETDPFYIDTNRAMRDAFRYVCERRPSCASRPGDPMRRIARMAERLRQEPIVGRAPNADGVVRKVKVDVGGLIYITTDAAYTPTIYRELDAAIRAALRKKRPYYRPLLRLARETYYVGGAGAVKAYSEGLYVAVACNDYPQAYEMTARIKERKKQYRAALDELRRTQPNAFAPFTIREWVTSPVEYYDSCIEWPRPSRVDPPIPPGATFPSVPTLVLSGDIDTLTSPEGAQQTAAAFPDSTYVEVANMTHVTALADFGRCTSDIVRRFVRTLDAGDTSCAQEYSEIRAVDKFSRRARAQGDISLRRLTTLVGARTVGDAMARWFEMYGYDGVGLRGGTFTTTGGPLVKWKLDEVRWVDDVAVSGSASWDRTTGAMRATIELSGRGASSGRLKIRWNDWERLAEARVKGVLRGRVIDVTIPAP
jgi:pimeloyl-ACP methyl ester carboxylesterase